MNAADWDTWLREWNQELLARFDPGTPDAFVDPAVTRDVVASGWLGSSGATEADVSALEERLGTRLPSSYRTFLHASNGFLQPGVIVPRLLGCHEVEWFRVAHQDTIDAWTQGMSAGGGGVDDTTSFERHLPAALQVSAQELVGTAVYLLNPEVVGTDGEWEALYFAHWCPGAERYPSFWALMQAERQNLLAPPPPAPPSRPRTYWDALRWIFSSKSEP